MAKYIDLDQVIRFIKENGYIYAKTLETWPSADVVEVVRCKDCRFAEFNSMPLDTNEGWCNYNDFIIFNDDYCSRGKREDNDED